MHDLELALLGILGGGQLLGEAITAPSAPSVQLSRGLVRLRVPQEVARRATTSGALVLRDEESTPLARLDQVVLTDIGAGTQTETGSAHVIPGLAVIQGVIAPLRMREGGQARAFALALSDLGIGDPERALVVFGRPPVAGDAEPARSMLGRAPGQVLAVVPDSPGGDIPTAVMLAVAQLWIDDAGLDSRAEVRTAPVAWRDPESDARLVGLLGCALGTANILHLAASDQSAPGQEWAKAREALISGDGTGLDALSPAIAARLRRWRPPRAKRGLVLMFTGLSGSGKSTLARDLSEWIRVHSERTTTLLDGDVVRTMLSSELGYDRRSRELNVRRIGYVAAEIARHGGIAICAPIAPYAATRAVVRAMAQQVGDFVLVHVSTPLAECERRDLKGLYAKARAGLIPEFTGISDPYEMPEDADVTIDTSVLPRERALSAVLLHLREGRWLPEEVHQ